MEFTLDKHEQYVVLTLKEPAFNNDITPALKATTLTLSAEGFCNIVFDLSAVQSCPDSQDLSSLLAADRLCKKANGLFVICGAQSDVLSQLEMSSLDQQLTIVSKLEEAADLIFMSEIEKDLLGSFDEESE